MPANALEFLLYSVAAVAARLVWSPAVAAAAATTVFATIITGAAGIRWLLRSAPLVALQWAQ